MGLAQFRDTITQLLLNEGVPSSVSIYRHLKWEVRRATRKFPCELWISRSRMVFSRHSGIAALVNALGMYDYNNMMLVRLALTSGCETFIDVGANVGAYTLVATEIQKALVVSVEAHPGAFADLQKNLALNARKNALCVNVAASDFEGQAIFTDELDLALNRVVQSGERIRHFLSVPAKTLDRICSDLGVEPHVVKIDVEGHEPQVLKGLGKQLQRTRLLILEGGDRLEVKEVLLPQGFIGPMFFRSKLRRFQREPQPRPEDPIYLRREFAADLQSEHGICINGETGLDPA